MRSAAHVIGRNARGQTQPADASSPDSRTRGEVSYNKAYLNVDDGTDNLGDAAASGHARGGGGEGTGWRKEERGEERGERVRLQGSFGHNDITRGRLGLW